MTLTDAESGSSQAQGTPLERVRPRSGSAEADARRRETEYPYDEIRRPRLVQRRPRGGGEAGLREPHACPGAGYPAGSGRPRPHRRRLHRHRQDGRVPAAHLEHASPREGPQPRPARAGGEPHPRARPADRPHVHADLAPDPPLHHHGVRRHALRPPDQGAARRHRRAHRHARAPEGPHEARRGEPVQRGGARAGRGRPHAGHGLSARRDHHRGRHARVPPDASVLGHHRPVHPEEPGLASERPRHGRDRPQRRDGQDGGAVHDAHQELQQARAAWRPCCSEKGSERVIVFARTKNRTEDCAEALCDAGFRAESIHSDKSPGRRAVARWRTSAAARRPSSWPPTCWRAASTCPTWTM